MTEQTSPSASNSERAPFYTAPSLPKGGGTVSVGGGMLSTGGPDGAAGWQLPLPSPAGRALSASLALQYSSGGGNSPFGAGWDCALPAVMRMTRFGFPKYDATDRLVGPSGVEILRAGQPRQATHLPFTDTAAKYTVTPWRARTGSPAERLEHWVGEGVTDDPGFWLHFLPDGSLSLYGWSPSARLHDPAVPMHVAGWQIEETVSARGEHVVYVYKDEDQKGCEAQELKAYPTVTNLYPHAVYAMNATPSDGLLIPQDGFNETDFLAFTVFDYGERGADPSKPPLADPIQDWPLRVDRHSFWRYGFNVRIRRLCRDVLLWHRTARMQGEADHTPELVARLHLQYDCSPVTSILVAAEQLTHEPASRMPPMEFELTRPGRTAPGWEAVPGLDGFWSPLWQMADLYGEGVPGLLYRGEGGWRYRAPQRDTSSRVAATDAITWGEPVTLPQHPSLTVGILTDLDGDGRPEWLVTDGGLRGSFTLAPDGTWGSLKPLVALPAEYGHPFAQLADLTGDGLLDVVMLRALGPRTVRLYASAGTQGWPATMIEQYQGREPLPSLAESEHELVAFADPAGSGQSHLLRISGEGVTMWPSLGYGKFADALKIPGFEVKGFNASRVFLADTDGSGTTDILYLEPDRIRVFVSQCGNRYQESAPIPAPDGVTLDFTCELQVADIRGQGTADLLLTVPHGMPDQKPRSWLYRFNDHRPWLLQTISDNAGSTTELEYRSSAQAWLDEKAAVVARTGKVPVSYLPFPVHTVSRVTTVNQITGLCMGSQTTYLGGVWDGKEREFAGFSRLIQTDTHDAVQAAAAHLSPPSRACTWFYTGLEERDVVAEGAFVEMDARFPQGPVRFTRWAADEEQAFDPDPVQRAWLYQAVRGQVMRTEVYGEDGHEHADKPYSVSRPRLQVRAYENLDSQRPSMLVTPVQALSFACERITQDPVVSQSIVLQQDFYGSALQSVAINYPRQLTLEQLQQEETARRIYPASLPAGLIEASCDAQQYDCWVNLTRASVHNLVDEDDFVIGLPGDTRTDVVHFTVADVPEGGFSVESLQAQPLPLDDPSRATLKGYQKVIWRRADGSGASSTPSRQALVAYTRTAMLDKASLDVLRPTFEQTLQGLVQDTLENPSADPAVLTRVRQRLAQAPDNQTLYRVLMAYRQSAPQDEAATRILRDALKSVISVEKLQQRLLEAEPEGLPDGLQAAVKKQSRVSDAALGAVVAWLAEQEGEHSDFMRTLRSELESAMSKSAADAVFWRAVLPAMQSADGPWLNVVCELLQTPVQSESLGALLKRGGYIAMNQPVEAEELADPADTEGHGAPCIPYEPIEEAYAGHHGITVYQGAEHFWQPGSVQESTVTGPSQLFYTAHDIAVCRVTDAAGLTSSVEAYDWRFLSPVKMKDANDNISEAKLDGLGRVMHTRFYGTETPAGSDVPVMSGYSPDVPYTPPSTPEAAAMLNYPEGEDIKAKRDPEWEGPRVPVAQAFTYVADSWMPEALDAEGNVDKPKRCGELAWQRQVDQLRRDYPKQSFTMTGRKPPHVIQLQTDRYDSDKEQQVRVRVTLNGGGQELQTAILNPAGKAFARTDAGGLEVDKQGKAIEKEVKIRWAVTGKTEFDNKGQAVRVWLPFYLDDWRWVSDDSAREGIYADTHIFDALGRECQVVRAAGEDVEGVWANYERRVQVFPWFTVSWDENDLWQEVIEQARLKARRVLH